MVLQQNFKNKNVLIALLVLGEERVGEQIITTQKSEHVS